MHLHINFYPRAVILHKCVVLDYICQTSQQHKQQIKTRTKSCHDDNL